MTLSKPFTLPSNPLRPLPWVQNESNYLFVTDLLQRLNDILAWKHHTKDLMWQIHNKCKLHFWMVLHIQGLGFRSKLCKQTSWELLHHIWCSQSIFTPLEAYLLFLLPTKASISFHPLTSYWLLALPKLSLPEPSFLHGEQEEASITKEVSYVLSVLREWSNLDAVSIIPSPGTILLDSSYLFSNLLVFLQIPWMSLHKNLCLHSLHWMVSWFCLKDCTKLEPPIC